MESEYSEKGDKSEKKESKSAKKKPKYKLMKNKLKNYLLNLLSYIINNKNNFKEKLIPKDLEIILESTSNISTIMHPKYKTKINYASFNSKRDLIKNIKLYKQIPSEIEFKDEYYFDNSDFVTIDMHPQIQRGIKLDLSEFPLYSYENKELKQIDKNEIKNKITCKGNEYIFCAYISFYDIKDKNNSIILIENMMELDSFWNYFKYVFIIIQLEVGKLISKINEDDIIKKYFDSNNNNYIKNKDKICFLFNIMSNYKENNKNSGDNLVNIFDKTNKFLPSFFDRYDEMNYFFILDNNEKIVEIKALNLLLKSITFLLMEFKKIEDNKETLSYFDKKELEEKNQIKEAKKIIQFISDINKSKFDYIFDITYDFSLIFTPDDELTKIKLKKIKYLKCMGEFHTKDYNYLKNCSNLIKLPSCEFSFKEIPTIDIEIDFSYMECEKCKKIISDDSFLYYCYICKTKYCYECVQYYLHNNKGKQRYIDPKHNLIFFKTRNKNQFLNLDQEKIGKNRFVDCDENDLHHWSSTRCNGCEETFKEELARYICLNCKKGKQARGGYIDYCNECIEKMCKDKKDMEKLEKKADEIFTSFNNDFFDDYEFKIEHKHENHVYLMMPYQLGRSNDNYYIF